MVLIQARSDDVVNLAGQIKDALATSSTLKRAEIVTMNDLLDRVGR